MSEGASLVTGPREPASAEHHSTEDEQQKPAPTLLEQMGGISGLIYSSVPIVIFVLVNYLFEWQAALWAAVGVAVAIAVMRLIRREPLQPAISGLFGIAVAAFITIKTGSAKGFFAFGIWSSLVYCGAFLISALIRWPLAGVIWSTLNNSGFKWRSDRSARLYYDIATLVWILVFGSKFVVQQWLYDQNNVGLARPGPDRDGLPAHGDRHRRHGVGRAQGGQAPRPARRREARDATPAPETA